MAWKKGQSGNPKGRPHSNIVTLLKPRLIEVLKTKDEETGKTKALLIAEAIVDAALSGNVSAQALIWERVEGKVEGAAIAINLDNRKVEIIVQGEEGKGLVARILNGEGTPALEPGHPP